MAIETAGLFKMVARPVIGKLIALQSFFLSRPRIDIALEPNPESLKGLKSLGVSAIQIDSDTIPVTELKYDLEFYWNYIIKIKNNSSKTAYGIKIEKIYKSPIDYLSKLDELTSLKEGETVKLDYRIRTRKTMNGREAEEYRRSFPSHLDKLEIILSYTNEGRTRFYTKFTSTPDCPNTNEHLLIKPKEI